MCPSCVKVHSAEHVRLNTHGFYDCLEDLYAEVDSTVNNNLSILRQAEDKLKQAYQTKSQHRDQMIIKLKEMRTKIIETVNRYIDGIEEHILNQLNSSEETLE